MPITITLSSLVSHMPVERGDTVQPPGWAYHGVVQELDGGMVKLSYPSTAPAGFLSLSYDGCGLVYLYPEHQRTRPDGDEPIDHSSHSVLAAANHLASLASRD